MYSFQEANFNGFLSNSETKMLPIPCSTTLDFSIVSLLFLKKFLNDSSQFISSSGGC